MTNYLLELAAIHLVLVVGYWILLKKERQFGFMRMSLILITIASLIIPLITLPNLLPSEKISINQFYIDLTLMDVSLEKSAISASALPSSIGIKDLIIFAYLTISAFFMLKFSMAIFEVWRIRNKYKFFTHDGCKVYKIENLHGSFSFFSSIFIDNKLESESATHKAILLHELAHVKHKHSYDIILFELFKICFWWLPTSWFVLHEIKKIHEFQADADVLQDTELELYSSFLIHSTLKINGFRMGSSFNRNFIIKRINTMRKKTKNIEKWKVVITATLSSLLVLVFACSKEPNIIELQNLSSNHSANIDNGKEVCTVVEEPPVFEGGMSDFYNYVVKSISYPKKARAYGIQGRVFVEFIIEKDGSISSVRSLKGIGYGCDEEAVQAVRNAPKFVPGKKGGKTVRVRMIMPISFILNKNKSSASDSDDASIEVATAKVLGKDLKVEASFEKGMWSGSIFDLEGNPIPGVNIILHGKKIGTVSDAQGNFLLKTDSPNDLIFKSVGYKTLRINP